MSGQPQQGQEVDVDYFRRSIPAPAPLSSEEATSVDAPPRPDALSSHTPQTQTPTIPTLEGEIYTPAPSYDISLPVPLRKFDIFKVSSRRELFSLLTPTIPLNEYGLPRYIYRADLLDHRALQQSVKAERDDLDFRRSAGLLLGSTQQARANSDGAGNIFNPGIPHTLDESVDEAIPVPVDYIKAQDLLDAAIIQLEYHHGYPTFQDGSPLWERFADESLEAFSAFVEYLEQVGVRTIRPDDRSPTHIQTSPYTKEMCVEWFHLYFWQARARAFDMFQMAHHERVRIQRIMRTNDSHFIESERILTRLLNAFKSKTEEELASLKPESIVRMLEQVANLQRKALGIQNDQPRPTTVEVQMKQLADESGLALRQDTNDDMSLLLANPDALKTAQELIIKVNGGK